MSANCPFTRSASEIYRWRDDEAYPVTVSLVEANRRHDLQRHQVTFDLAARYSRVDFGRFIFSRRRGVA